MKKEKTKTERCEERIGFIKGNAEDVTRLINKSTKPNKFLVRDLLSLIVHMHEDIEYVIDGQLFED